MCKYSLFLVKPLLWATWIVHFLCVGEITIACYQAHKIQSTDQSQQAEVSLGYIWLTTMFVMADIRNFYIIFLNKLSEQYFCSVGIFFQFCVSINEQSLRSLKAFLNSHRNHIYIFRDFTHGPTQKLWPLLNIRKSKSCWHV